MPTHKELRERQAIIQELDQLIQVRARMAAIQDQLANPALPIGQRILLGLELRRLEALERPLVDTLTARAVPLATPQAERDQRRADLDADLAALVPALDPGVPLALLPVRLETRFLPAAGGNTELLVRIYPDAIHLDHHEPKLTTEEADGGQKFRIALAAAADLPTQAAQRTAAQEAWMALAARFGPARAAWIHHALAPTAPADPRAFQIASCLPERWIIRGYNANAGLVFEQWSAVTPTTVQTGPDPQVPDTDGGIGDGMRWMVEFQAALDAGMATRATLDAGQVTALRRIVVLGVRGAASAAEGGQAFAGLLAAHHYTDGLALIAQGTPTNNTSDARAGRLGEGPLGDLVGEHAFDVEVDAIWPGPGGQPVAPAGRDGYILARALGAPLPADPTAPTEAELARFPFTHVAGASGIDQAAAEAMNRVLWPATGRYFTEQMLSGGRPRGMLFEQHLFDEHAPRVPEAWGQFFAETVRGRGPLPALRAGAQPYGILPVTHLRPLPGDNAPDLIVFTAFQNQDDRTEQFQVGWDVDLPAGWDQQRVGWGERQPTSFGLTNRAAMCISAVTRPIPHRALVLLREELDPATDQPATSFSSAILSGGGIGAWSRPTVVPFMSEDTGRVPAITAFDAGPAGQGLIIARANDAGGYVRTRTARQGPLVSPWDQPLTWSASLPGPLLDLSMATGGSRLGSPPLLLLFMLVDEGQPALYVQSAPVSDILQGQGVNWAGPFRLAQLDSRLLRPRALRLQAVLLKVEADGRMALQCVIVCRTPGGLLRKVLHGDNVSIDGTSGNWRELYSGADFPPGDADVFAMAAASTELGPSPLPAVARGRAGWVNLLLRLRSAWRDAAGGVPRLGRTRDSGADLLEVLGQLPAAGEIGLRPMIGPLLSHHWRWLGEATPEAGYEAWRDAKEDRLLRHLRLATLADAELLQLAPDARLPASVFGETVQRWSGPLVEAGPLSETVPLADNYNYLHWLASATPREIHGGAYPGGKPPDALLYHLLRHATLQAYADAALAFVNVPNILDPEYIGLRSPEPGVVEPATRTAWRNLSGALPPGRRLDAEILKELSSPSTPGDRVPELRQFLASLEFLAGLPTAALDRLLRETLDLFSHRLDAWITAFATERLREMRATAPEGLHLGAYGWVEWREAPLARPRAVRPAGGFIHAPSLGHATTAALLRSAYLSHNAAGQHGPFALDLSSRRLRLALAVLDEVRSGRPLYEALGYRFERSLHERSAPALVGYIDELRRLAPLVAKPVGQNGAAAAADASPALSPHAVVHGLTLLERWRSGVAANRWDATTLPFGETNGLPAAGSPEGAALLEELAALDDIVDGVADLLLAESVFQAVRSNAVRGGATLTGASSGEVRPPEPEIARTPRTGIGVTHRVAVVLPPHAPLPAGWVTSPREAAEPRLSGWVASLLGPPEQVRFRVQYEDAKGAAFEPERSFTAADVQFSPFEVLALLPGANPKGQSEVEARCRDAAMHPTNGGPPPAGAADVRLIFNRAPEWAAADLSVPEWLERARVVCELVAGSRALAPADLSGSGAAVQARPEDAELGQRWSAARDGLQDLIDSLRDLFRLNAADVTKLGEAGLLAERLADLKNLLDLPSWAPWTAISTALDLRGRLVASALRATLRAFTAYGIPGATPVVDTLATDAAAAALTAQAQRILADAKDRLADAKDPPVDAGRDATDAERIETLFGAGFRVLPHFTPSQSFWDACSARTNAGDAEPAATQQWFRGVAGVRAGVRRLSDALLNASAPSDAAGAFMVAQFPLPQPGQLDRWAGAKTPDGEPFPAGRTAIACYAPVALDPDAPVGLAGLFVDDWVETVPGGTEVTGVTFHYDAPGAQAPQAILLAVPPTAGDPWSVDLLQDTLHDTLELVRLRLVDGDALNRFGQMLPALLFAHNVRGDTVATTFLKPA